MNPLLSRKQLLITESELNRAHLLQDWQTLAGEAHALIDQARTIRSLSKAAVSLVSVVSGLTSLCRKKPVASAEKPAWWQILLKGLGVAGSLWSEFNSQRGQPQKS